MVQQVLWATVFSQMYYSKPAELKQFSSKILQLKVICKFIEGLRFYLKFRGFIAIKDPIKRRKLD